LEIIGAVAAREGEVSKMISMKYCTSAHFAVDGSIGLPYKNHVVLRAKSAATCSNSLKIQHNSRIRLARRKLIHSQKISG
jgi:hypothetical protein